jgi:hypothetical protein
MTTHEYEAQGLQIPLCSRSGHTQSKQARPVFDMPHLQVHEAAGQVRRRPAGTASAANRNPHVLGESRLVALSLLYDCAAELPSAG